MIASARLLRLRLSDPHGTRPEETVAWCGAVQAQDYPSARWALALRMSAGVDDASIARAVDEGRVLRTHVLRPTWHFVAAADVGWMLDLTGPRIQRSMASYYPRHGLDKALLTRGTNVIEGALRDGRQLTRPELGKQLQRSGVHVTGIALALLMIHAECEQVICSGAFRGRQLTYALFADRVPSPRRLTRDEALAELTGRYFRSHGPATARDFAWWSGLTAADARRGLEIVRASSQTVDGLCYWTTRGPLRKTKAVPRSPHVLLLPPYDEYVVAYRDRQAVPHGLFSVNFGAVVIDGHIAGMWKPASKPVAIEPFRRFLPGEQRAIARAIDRYERFRE